MIKQNLFRIIKWLSIHKNIAVKSWTEMKNLSRHFLNQIKNGFKIDAAHTF